MLRKIQGKVAFARKLIRISADAGSSAALLYEFGWLSYQRFFGKKNRPFSCRVKIGDQTATIYLTGTMGELLTLVDIFVDHSYAPKHAHSDTLFPQGIKTILDLGANVGIASMWFLLTYPEATLHAYEPSPNMCALLKKNLSQFPNALVHEKAITGLGGTTTFNQSVYSLESSIFEARNSTTLSVPASTLDQAIEAIGGSVDYMKIDIEGAEFDAFKTCTKLASVKAMVGEVHTEQSGHKDYELRELLSSFTMLEIYNPNNDTVFGFYAAHITR